ncbi:hypothetical protein PR002_g6864 [Phytophthora rubi]|uniref:Uncharacterized protein n=1 Tax=Phytophthora rubi TaxID=129364 RepID=A0A6A3N766_9STRA|nr:hypothetical protein PR002_g6864 [Phytophthora rubi]
MKLQIVIAAIAALLLPVHGASNTIGQRCAGAFPSDDTGIVYENTGFLTADFTQKSCVAAGGSIDPNKNGNEKCCEVSNAQIGTFTSACFSQKAGSKYPSFSPYVRRC